MERGKEGVEKGEREGGRGKGEKERGREISREREGEMEREGGEGRPHTRISFCPAHYVTVKLHTGHMWLSLHHALSCLLTPH